VSPRLRVFSIVLAAALLAAGATVAGVVLFRDDESAGPRPREGVPPLVLDLGVRTDREAVALRRGERLYAAERRGEAARIFARYGSPEARVGAALARWPRGSLTQLERLAAEHSRNSLVQLHLGFVRFWAGRDGPAVTAWRAAARAQPDSASAVRAEDLLHPDFPRGQPLFVPSFPSPADLRGLSPPRQLALLERRARGGDLRAKLLYGLALQRLMRRVSARRQYDAAAAQAPGNAEAQVAAAVGRFDKANPSASFARLGPLTRRFPRAQTVRYHLGLLLLWLARVQPGAVENAKRQLALARAQAPRSRLGREAARLLDRLESVETR
jgi:hypothetical protein